MAAIPPIAESGYGVAADPPVSNGSDIDAADILDGDDWRGDARHLRQRGQREERNREHARSDTSERLGRLAQATNRSRSWLANEAIDLVEEEAFLAAVERGAAQADAGEVLGSAEALVELHRRLEARFGDDRA